MKVSKKEKIEELEFSILRLRASRGEKGAKIVILNLEVEAIEERLITLKKELASVKRSKENKFNFKTIGAQFDDLKHGGERRE